MIKPSIIAVIYGLSILVWCAKTVHSNISLPIGDINIVIVTDVHSWVAGHGLHEEFDVNYGHVYSFVERLKVQVPNTFFVMNGDFMDGTGLSEHPPTALVPILRQMQWDALTFGNRDIKDHETVKYLIEPGGLVSWFGRRLLTSNVLLKATDAPVGNSYEILKGDSVDVLAFGFLYNMQSPYSHLLTIQKVQQTVEQPWFHDALKGETYGAILVLAHMDIQDELAAVILREIRGIIGPAMPVLFINGHTHYRAITQWDQLSSGIEAGALLDTVGFVSMPKKGSSSFKFQHRFLDATVDVLSSVLGVSDIMTTRGQEVADFIARTRQGMGLTDIIGCSPEHFELDTHIDAENSLWGLYQKQVLPSQFKPDDGRYVVIQSKATSLNYDLFKGNITVDDVHTLNPSNEEYYLVKREVSRGDVLTLLSILNNPNHHLVSAFEHQPNEYLPNVPNYILMGNIEGFPNSTLYDVYTIASDVPYVIEPLETALGDDAGNLKPVSSGIGATQVWFDFVRKEWPNCSTPWHLPANEQPMPLEHRKNFGMLWFGVISILASFVFLCLQGKFQHCGKRYCCNATDEEGIVLVPFIGRDIN